MRWPQTSRESLLRLIAALALAPALAFAQSAPGSLRHAADARDLPPADEPRPLLPPFPAQRNLVKVQVDGLPNFEYFVDLESVSIGAEGAVWYTVVARAAGGASNISFEGLRCKERERMLYALGRTDGTWSLARNPQWVPVSELPVNRIQATLSDRFFCPVRTRVPDAAEAKNRLKWGGDRRCFGATRSEPGCPDG